MTDTVVRSAHAVDRCSNLKSVPEYYGLWLISSQQVAFWTLLPNFDYITKPCPYLLPIDHTGRETIASFFTLGCRV